MLQFQQAVLIAVGSQMYGVRLQFALGRLAACICLILVCPAFAGQMHRKPHKAAPIPADSQPVPAPAADPEPPPPLTLQQMPASPPQVTYDHGALTIISQNSTLGDILRAVRDRTGAALDVPGNANERVAGQMGPGTPRDVLAQLLSGSRFNYVILGSATDSAKVEKVILSAKPANLQENAGQPTANVPAPQQGNSGQFGYNDQATSEDEDDTAAEPSADQQNPNQQPAQAPIRTPEQLLQELQRQQQQQAQPQPTQPQQGPPAAPAQRERN